MKRGGCEFGGRKTGAVLYPNRGGGAVVSQLVLKLKESVPPPPPGLLKDFHVTVKGLSVEGIVPWLLLLAKLCVIQCSEQGSREPQT